MKTELTIEESAKLIERGVDAKLASADGYLPVFTLPDILNILPKEIFYRGLPRPLGMEYSWEDETWDAYYLGGNHIETAPEFIDSLYQLLIYCINNGHYNSKNNDKEKQTS